VNGCRERGKRVEMCRHTTSERSRRDLYAAASMAQALPLDGLMLEKLVGGSFDDQSIPQHAALHDTRRWWG
jgi:hypothetical protein